MHAQEEVAEAEAEGAVAGVQAEVRRAMIRQARAVGGGGPMAAIRAGANAVGRDSWSSMMLVPRFMVMMGSIPCLSIWRETARLQPSQTRSKGGRTHLIDLAVTN